MPRLPISDVERLRALRKIIADADGDDLKAALQGAITFALHGPADFEIVRGGLGYVAGYLGEGEAFIGYSVMERAR
jgi:hypothetical protein